jgi:hypothetical protein
MVFPGEVLWPVFGFGALISFVVAGIVAIRLVNHKLRQSQLRSGEGLEEVHARLAEIDQLNQRINELEERVDFTERLLATRNEEPRQLP